MVLVLKQVFSPYTNVLIVRSSYYILYKEGHFAFRMKNLF